jgi:hypothetical protein
MTATIADAVFDAALNHVKSNVDIVQLVTSASSVLVAITSIDSGNFTGPGDGSTGRKLSCLTSCAEVSSASVSSGGSISKLRLLDSAAVLVTADVASAPVNVGSSDTVTIGSFKIELADPT